MEKLSHSPYSGEHCLSFLSNRAAHPPGGKWGRHRSIEKWHQVLERRHMPVWGTRQAKGTFAPTQSPTIDGSARTEHGWKAVSGAEQSSRENSVRDELPDLPELLDAAHGTPVELDAGADTVDARAKDQDVRRPKGEVVGGAPVRQVQVVRLRWPLRGHCVNLFHRWADPQLLTQLANSQLCAKGKRTET